MTTTTAMPPTQTGRVPAPGREFVGPIALSGTQRVGPGQVLAVCGLAGGVGVTTLSYLVALVAAREGRGPVLVADTGGPNADLAVLAGVEVPRTLSALAEQLAAGVPLGAGVYATGESGLRVLASGPEFSSPAVDGDVRGLLGHARQAHTLTVIDCGTLTRTAQQTTAAAATHVVWVLTATRRGVERGQRVLEAAPSPPGKGVIVARGDGDQPTVPLRRLRQIAADRSTPVVLMPHLELSNGRVEACLDAAQVPVRAILGWLAR